MKHLFRKGDPSKPTFLLLHGTGGTERDLLPLADMIDPGASVLGVRGNVIENGMPRFFRRLAEGVFDEEDLIFQTTELNKFLDEAANEHGFDRQNVMAIGFSNGANIAASLLIHFQDVLKGGMLLHPMVPLRGLTLPDLKGTSLFIGAGENDPLCKPEETNELAEMLKQAGAPVDVHWERGGHQLTQNELSAAIAWYQQHFTKI